MAALKRDAKCVTLWGFINSISTSRHPFVILMEYQTKTDLPRMQPYRDRSVHCVNLLELRDLITIIISAHDWWLHMKYTFRDLNLKFPMTLPTASSPWSLYNNKDISGNFASETNGRSISQIWFLVFGTIWTMTFSSRTRRIW